MDSAAAAVRSLSPHDRRCAAGIGRQARLELTFAVRNGRTVLADAYAEPPFRVGRPFADGAGLFMILASSAPGWFGGDHTEQTIRLEPGARVRLASQSSLQVHPSTTSAPARAVSTYQVGAGAVLQCCWHPTIPFAASRFDQQIDIELEAGARLVWSDAVMSGREGSGERWAFSTFAHQLKIRRQSTLEYLERYALDDGLAGLTRRWIAANANYFATTVVVGWPFEGADAERLHQTLGGDGGVSGAAEVVSPEVLVTRIMSASGVPFHRAREQVLAFWT